MPDAPNGRYAAATMVPIPSRAGRRDAGRRPIAAVAAVLTALLLVAVTPAVRADDPVHAVPDEPGVTIVDGVVYGALSADVDGDGVAGRWSPSPSRSANGAQLAVALWREAADGSWFTTGQAPLRRKVSPDERLSAVPHPDAQGILGGGPGRRGAAPRLARWRAHGRARRGQLRERFQRRAALLPHDLPGLGESAERRRCSPWSSDTGRGAQDAFAADLDGDGTEELVVLEPAAPATPSADAGDGAALGRPPVHQWSRAASSVMVSEDDPLSVAVSIIGELGRHARRRDRTGRRGGVGGGECTGSPWRLTRIAMRDAERWSRNRSVCPRRARRSPCPMRWRAGDGHPVWRRRNASDHHRLARGIARRRRIGFVVRAPRTSARRAWAARRTVGRPAPHGIGQAGPRAGPSGPVAHERPRCGHLAAAALFVDSPLTPYVGPWPATSRGAGWVPLRRHAPGARRRRLPELQPGRDARWRGARGNRGGKRRGHGAASLARSGRAVQPTAMDPAADRSEAHVAIPAVARSPAHVGDDT